MVILHNDVHKTEYRTYRTLKEIDALRYKREYTTKEERFMRRVRVQLCGIDDPRPYGTFGETRVEYNPAGMGEGGPLY